MDIAGEVMRFKTACLEAVRDKALSDWKDPTLRQLFFELTSSCNLGCAHCGSRCGPGKGRDLSMGDIRRVLERVREDCKASGNRLPFIVLTGGEPMLHPDFHAVVRMIHDLHFSWGMTTNGTLADPEAVAKLAGTGMYSVSVSIDGPEEVHDALRGTKGAYARAMAGLENLCSPERGLDVMVTTVVTKDSIGLLDRMFELIEPLPIDTWRVANIEPMGNALDHPELLLDREDYVRLFDFIKAKREANIPVTYGCCHYLGPDYELELRNWAFQCCCGTEIMSIAADGSILGCLDVPRDGRTVQGNIYDDDVMDVWRNGFGIFRQDLSERCLTCHGCDVKRYCRGGARHSYDYIHDEQRLCMREILF